MHHLHTPVDSAGLGWGVGPVHGIMSSGHVGGFMAVVSIWSTKDLAAAVVANMESDRTEQACRAALDAIYRLFAT